MKEIGKPTKPYFYADAAVETLKIIANSDEEVRERIPDAFIRKLSETSAHSDHRFVLDRTLSLAEQDLLPETRQILLMIYEQFLETPHERSRHLLAEIEQFRNNKIEQYKALMPEGADDDAYEDDEDEETTI